VPLKERVKSVPYRLDQAAADTAAAAFPRTHINVSCPHLSPSARVHGIIEAGSAERRDRLCRRALTLNYPDPVQRANRRRQSLRWREVLWRAGQQVLLYADGGKTMTLRADRKVATGSAPPIVMSLSGHPQQGLSLPVSVLPSLRPDTNPLSGRTGSKPRDVASSARRRPPRRRGRSGSGSPSSLRLHGSSCMSLSG